MKRISNKSKIEVWSSSYINNSSDKPRQSMDSPEKVDIIQIEPGYSGDDYMVEIEPKEEFATPTGEYKWTDANIAEEYNKGKRAGMNYVLNKIKEEKGNPNTNWDYNQLTAFADFVKKLIMV